MAILKLKNDTTKEWEDVITIKGDKGDKPYHEIDGTKIRFQNPDGTYGEWIELEVLTAEQVPTIDGSNVQTKLDNSFSLGTLKGTSLKQNLAGIISLKDSNLNDVLYTGFYHCQGCTNIPGTENGYVVVESLGGTYCKQTYTINSSTLMSFERQLIGGTWTSWRTVSGDTGWKSASGYNYRKKNGIVTIVIQATLQTVTTWTTLSTALPEGFRPTVQILGQLHANTSATTLNNTANIIVNSAGVISYMNPNASTGFIGNISFPVD